MGIAKGSIVFDDMGDLGKNKAFPWYYGVKATLLPSYWIFISIS